jgi:integrase
MTRGKGEGALFKDARGYWTVRIELPSHDGKRRQKVVRRKDKKAAMGEMAKIRKELDKLGDLPTSSLTLAKWLRRWIDEIAPAEIRPKSYASYKSTVDLWLIPILGRHKVDSLNADHIRGMFKEIMSTPKSHKLRGEKNLPEGTVMVGPDTAIKAHAVLSSALKTAMREGKATRNVCEMVDPPRKAKTVQGSLSANQAIELLAHLATREDRALWACYLLTGARRGEILGLEADRVTDTLDLSWQLLRITEADMAKAPTDYERRHLSGSLWLTRPKSSSGWRIIPLVEPLRSILALHMQGRGPGLVFTREDGTPWDPDTITDAWAALMVEAGMPSGVVLHGARHTMIDILDAAGVDRSTQKDLVGHSSIKMTEAYRTRTDQKKLTAALEQMSGLLEQ